MRITAETRQEKSENPPRRHGGTEKNVNEFKYFKIEKHVVE
jgi:hypothetical protein